MKKQKEIRAQRDFEISRNGIYYRSITTCYKMLDVKQNDDFIKREKQILISREGIYYRSKKNTKLANEKDEHNTKGKNINTKRQCNTTKCNIALAICTVLTTLTESVFKGKEYCNNAIVSSLIMGLISVIIMFNAIDKQEQLGFEDLNYKLMKVSNSCGVMIFVNYMINMLLKYEVLDGIGAIVICIPMIWWSITIVRDIIRKDVRYKL